MGVGAGLYMYDAVVKTFTFAISSILISSWVTVRVRFRVSVNL